MTGKTICIVGLGLEGGSYAMALTRAGNTVYGVDIRPQSIEFALQHGYIAKGAVEDFAPLVRAAQVVVLGLYPKTLLTWLHANAGLFQPGTVVTDLCGVKRGVVRPAQELMPPGVEYYSGHPMRGREVLGVENADCAIFKDANFILTPTEKNTPAGRAVVEDLARTVGFTVIKELSCEEHDQMIGYVSQLTHAIAVSLMTANDNTHLADFTGDSFRDLTRIARINEDLWSELFLWNREALTEEIDRFADSLQELKRCLRDEDAEHLKELFRLSSARRALFDRPAAEAATNKEGKS